MSRLTSCVHVDHKSFCRYIILYTRIIILHLPISANYLDGARQKTKTSFLLPEMKNTGKKKILKRTRPVLCSALRPIDGNYPFYRVGRVQRTGKIISKINIFVLIDKSPTKSDRTRFRDEIPSILFLPPRSHRHAIKLTELAGGRHRTSRRLTRVHDVHFFFLLPFRKPIRQACTYYVYFMK